MYSHTQGLNDCFSIYSASGEVVMEESSRNKNDVLFFSNGSAMWPITSLIDTYCNVDPHNFPFDTQTCFIRVSGWGTDASYINYTANDIHLDGLEINSEWDLVSCEAKSFQIRKAITMSDVKFYFTFKRRCNFYIFTILIPFNVVSVLGLLTFPLPPESGEKVSLGMTCLLSFFVIGASASEHLPTSSHSTPIIGLYT